MTTAADPTELDASQRAVLALPATASAAVIGAPGTGKTTTLVELVADRVLTQGWSSEAVLVLTPSRVTATRLRDLLALRLAVPTQGPLARTVNSLAFDIVGRAARDDGAVAPRLITGGEQDADLAGLLAGHIDDGSGPNWPEHLGPEVRRLRGFRTELRELMMRATEYGVSPSRLRELGVAHDRPEWVAAGDFIQEYGNVLGLSRPHQLDSAELVARAVALLGEGRPGELVEALRLVVVDDFQEATESVVSLLRALAARGVAIVAFGDPDIAANAFRGGEPDALGTLGRQLGIPDTVTLTLSTVYRQGPSLRSLTSRVTERVGTAAAGSQRRADAGGREHEKPIVIVKAQSPAREWASLARLLREHHLAGDVPFGRMAVVVRSGAQVPGLARALALAEVPTRTSAGRRALREDHAARALLTVVDVGMGRTELTEELATQLLLGPFGGLDRLTLRRLRLALRAEELAGDGTRTADELLVDALSAPGRFVTIDHSIARRAEKMASNLHELRGLADSGATIEELLWHAWEKSGLAGEWHAQSLSAGIAAAEANRNLDGIVALFSSAKRFVERLPGSPARVYLEEVLEAEVPEDSLSPQAHGDAVLVTTPSGVVGLEYDVVAVASLQEGIWPNMRIRGSLLGPQQLVRAITAMDSQTLDERRLVRDDELRMFALAVSRARKQVILSAADNDDEAASVLFSFVPVEVKPLDTSTLAPLSLRGFTGRVRYELGRALSDTDAGARDRQLAAASGLARLALDGVAGADPAQWHGLLDPSSTEPLFNDDEQVPVSPSRLQAFEDSPVDWFIDSIAGGDSNVTANLGTIVHWAMETSEESSVEALWTAIESRWKELVFEAPWVGDHQKVIARGFAAALAEYLGDFARDKKQTVGKEQRFELTIGRATVRGSIDRVELAPDGGVVIVDLKTGRPITAAAEIAAHPQLGVYQLAYADGVIDEQLVDVPEHHSAGAKLLFVKEGVGGKLYREGVQAPLSDEQLDELRERIRTVAHEMAAAEFPGVLEISEWAGFGAATRKLHRVSPISAVAGAHRSAEDPDEDNDGGQA